MPAALRLDGISKTFGDNRALDGAKFEAAWGELHGLLGENGAGKSSLMNVAAGLYQADAGSLSLDGVPIRVEGPAHARSLGIGMVHQHFKLVRPFSVAENVMLANPRGGWRSGLRQIADEIARLGAELGFEIDPFARTDSISVAEQQRVEIIKVLIGGARILILDEPTAVLTDEEADRLLKTARALAKSGTCVVLITHKLREVKDFADRVTIMRRGQTIATENPQSVSLADLARMMVGTAPPDDSAPPGRAGAVRLQLHDIAAARGDGVQTVRDVSLMVSAGQIYGIAGVGGNGQTELAEVLMGVRAPQAGRVVLDGVGITHAHPRRRRARGMSSVPADRFRYGLAADLSVSDNFTATGLSQGAFGNAVWVARSKMRRATQAAIDTFEIHGATAASRARLLSGGNAQKLVLARELSGQPTVIIAHSPTRGLDVRAAAAVHDYLRRARDAGAAVLLISEDLDEVLNLSDVAGVINRGRIVGEFTRPIDRQAVGGLMVGHA